MILMKAASIQHVCLRLALHISKVVLCVLAQLHCVCSEQFTGAATEAVAD
jgi:hypothetical protein